MASLSFSSPSASAPLPPAVFAAAAGDIARAPPADRPEIAFAGRSNCGKSSLLNALFERKALARTSKRPGRTQTLNFYALGDRAYGVDMPGYGYAEVARSTRLQWRRLIETYLAFRPNLRLVCVLIDSRRGLMRADREMLTMLAERAAAATIILTKADRMPTDACETLRKSVESEIEAYPSTRPSCLVTSSRSGLGIAALRAALADLIADSRPSAGAVDASRAPS